MQRKEIFRKETILEAIIKLQATSCYAITLHSTCSL